MESDALSSSSCTSIFFVRCIFFCSFGCSTVLAIWGQCMNESRATSIGSWSSVSTGQSIHVKEGASTIIAYCRTHCHGNRLAHHTRLRDDAFKDVGHDGSPLVVFKMRNAVVVTCVTLVVTLKQVVATQTLVEAACSCVELAQKSEWPTFQVTGSNVLATSYYSTGSGNFPTAAHCAWGDWWGSMSTQASRCSGPIGDPAMLGIATT